jgi:hypothetical protein
MKKTKLATWLPKKEVFHLAAELVASGREYYCCYALEHAAELLRPHPTQSQFRDFALARAMRMFRALFIPPDVAAFSEKIKVGWFDTRMANDYFRRGNPADREARIMALLICAFECEAEEAAPDNSITSNPKTDSGEDYYREEIVCPDCRNAYERGYLPEHTCVPFNP